MKHVKIEKSELQWLFGGLGFHNSEATMLGIMSDEFLQERVLKSVMEISPTLTRVYGAFPDWTQEAMDRFADYYDMTFAKTDTSMYIVPGRMPLHETHEEMEKFASDVADKLEYLYKKRNMKHIRYFCSTNELSVGNTYALLADDMEKFKEYQHLLWKEFRKRDLPIGLVASDGSGFQNFWQIEWCAKNMDEFTDTYCAHNYEICGKNYDSRKFYDKVYKEVSKVVQIAIANQKRFMMGEFGIHDGGHFTSKVMRNDVFAGYGDKRGEAEAALMSVQQAMALINAGSIGGVYWSFCDYPDPMIKDWSNTEKGKRRFETARFSGHGIDVRYNKNGCFRWNDDDNDYSSRPFLYSLGLMSKYFKRGSRVLTSETDDKNILCCAVRNGDKSHSICLVNLSSKPTEAEVSISFDAVKPYRKYSFAVDNVPYNEFNDLQQFDEILVNLDGKTTVKLPEHSMIVLTTDYEESMPKPVEGIVLKDKKLTWSETDDENHRYYRVYEDGKQIASTVATYLERKNFDPNKKYEVFSVNKWGNCLK